MGFRRACARGVAILVRTLRPAIASLRCAIGLPAMNELQARVGTGFHEAGHAVIAWACGRSVSSVHIYDGQNGRCYNQRFNVADRDEYDLETWRRIVRQECIYSLAGGLAEEKKYPGTNWDGCDQDLADARHWLRELRHCGARIGMDELVQQTRELIDVPKIWTAIWQVTRRLVPRHRLDGRDVIDVCVDLRVPNVR
jgi:hypothetical protein